MTKIFSTLALPIDECTSSRDTKERHAWLVLSNHKEMAENHPSDPPVILVTYGSVVLFFEGGTRD